MEDIKHPKKLITLAEASRLCNYSQDYLSLRARNHKLKSLKIGNNWMTTSLWLNEYIDRTTLFKKTVEEKRLARQKSADILEPILIPITEAFKSEPGAASANTDINDNTDDTEPEEFEDVELLFESAIEEKAPVLRFSFVLMLTIALVASGIFFGRNTVRTFFADTYDLAEMIGEEMSYTKDKASLDFESFWNVFRNR